MRPTWAAGSATVPASYMMRGLYPTLPAGCITPKVKGNTYLCGNTRFHPSCGANRVPHRVMPTP